MPKLPVGGSISCKDFLCTLMDSKKRVWAQKFFFPDPEFSRRSPVRCKVVTVVAELWDPSSLPNARSTSQWCWMQHFLHFLLVIDFRFNKGNLSWEERCQKCQCPAYTSFSIFSTHWLVTRNRGVAGILKPTYWTNPATHLKCMQDPTMNFSYLLPFDLFH